MTENKYFCYCWRDAIEDPPADPTWWGYLREKATGRMYLGQVLPAGSKAGFEWMDITAIPAVPRETVQAAVDEMASSNYAAGPAVQLVEAGDDAIDFCIDVIADHTGITPSTAEESSVAQEVPHA